MSPVAPSSAAAKPATDSGVASPVQAGAGAASSQQQESSSIASPEDGGPVSTKKRSDSSDGGIGGSECSGSLAGLGTSPTMTTPAASSGAGGGNSSSNSNAADAGSTVEEGGDANDAADAVGSTNAEAALSDSGQGSEPDDGTIMAYQFNMPAHLTGMFNGQLKMSSTRRSR